MDAATGRFSATTVGAVVLGGAASAVLSATACRRLFLAERWTLFWLLVAWAVASALLTAGILRLPGRWSLGAAVAFAIVLRLLALGSGTLSLSDDSYRYVWDGRVQAAGIDPYKTNPGGASLRSLREPFLWPDDAGCRHLERDSGCTRINRPAVRTIYPPVAEAWFRAVYAVGGIDAGTRGFQVAAALVDVALVGLLAWGLRHLGHDPRLAGVYALCPVPILELAGNAHVDGLAALCCVAAVLAFRRRPALAGVLVGAAALVKLYPGLLVVALWRRPGRWRVVAAAATATVLAYLPHVLGVGLKVLGYLPGYLQEEKYDQGSRFLLVGVVPGPATLSIALAVLSMLAVIGVVLWRRPPVEVAAAQLVGALLLIATPVQPWYAVTLVALAVLARSWHWLAVAFAGYPYFFAVILDHPHPVAIGRLAYGAALAVVVVGERRRATSAPAGQRDADRGDGDDRAVQLA